jgi:hypothetical protein
MIKASAAPFVTAHPGSPDSDNPDYSFEILSWIEPPAISGFIIDDSRSHDRELLLTKYRSTANPIDWHRYLTLGLHVFADGNKFHEIWHRQPADLLTRYRIVWYNYKFHLDNSIKVPSKLHVWATQLAKPYLRIHDLHFLDIDTHSTQWKHIEQDILDLEEGWNEVGPKKANKHVTYNLEPSKAPEASNRIRPPNAGSSLLASTQEAKKNPAGPQLTPLTSLGSMARKTTPGEKILQNLAKKGIAGSIAAWIPSPDETAPAPTSPKPSSDPVPTPPAPPHNKQDDDMSDAKQSAFKPSLNVPTHDGTQRITIRWTPQAGKSLSPD